MKTILNRLYLSIRLGGDGMMNSEEIREAAYVGSLLQCAPTIRQFCATAGLLPTDTMVAMSIHEFELAHQSLLSKGVTCLTALTSINIWTSRPQLRMRKRLQTSSNHCVVQLHFELFRPAHRTQGVLSIHSPTMTSPDVAKESPTIPAEPVAPG